ncbi:MAG: 5'-nucleotidase C-terminal domain-containing protein, partial [Pseudomonadota bacterium]
MTILATSDLHMNLAGFHYYADRASPGIGLTRTATLIRRERARASAADATLVLADNGDSLQGTPLADVAARDSACPHPLMAAFRLLEYDVIGLGNHDFDYGLETLKETLDKAPCPVLCSNASVTDGTAPWTRYCILDTHISAGGDDWPFRIGFLSVLPEQTRLWNASVLNGRLKVADMVGASQNTAQILKREGCDLVVALAHTGIGQSEHFPEQENAAIPIAALQDIEVIVCGHTHTLFPDPSHPVSPAVDPAGGLIHGKPVVLPGSAGSHLGVVDLTLSATGSGGWAIAKKTTCLKGVGATAGPESAQTPAPEAADILDAISEYHSKTRRYLAQTIGEIRNAPLHSYFTFLGIDRSAKLIAAAQAATTRQLLSGTNHAGLPVLSAVAPSKFGGRAGPDSYTDIPVGPAKMRHVADLYQYSNSLSALVVTGAQILEWLDTAARVFAAHPLPGSDGAELLNPDYAGHLFDVIYGLNYVIDLSVPICGASPNQPDRSKSGRIKDVRWNGNLIAPDQSFVVATNCYRSNGGGNFNVLKQAQRIDLPARNVQEIVCDYLSGTGPPDPLEHDTSPWHFAPLGGAVLTTRTGPGAEKHLH